MKKVHMKVDITIILPKWTDYNKVSREWKQAWDRFYEALVAHENKHKEFTIRAAEEIEAAIARLEVNGGCEQLKTRAESIYLDGLKRLRKIQIQFDKDTDHGATEGVVLERE